MGNILDRRWAAAKAVVRWRRTLEAQMPFPSIIARRIMSAAPLLGNREASYIDWLGRQPPPGGGCLLYTAPWFRDFCGQQAPACMGVLAQMRYRGAQTG
ncbi:hypothetical protein XHV734_1071 [Xanthomonas hortorum pv. vitians]|nr:hypothetical protein XHV734_1071 [Xanthomonas hortorum pv. vitians]